MISFLIIKSSVNRGCITFYEIPMTSVYYLTFHTKSGTVHKKTRHHEFSCEINSLNFFDCPLTRCFPKLSNQKSGIQ